MSGPSPDRFRRADALFDAALDLPSTEHAAFLDRECGEDRELRAEVDRLLAAYRSSGDFLEARAVELAAPLLRDAWEAEDAVIPPRLGPFRVLREIGHGGMGAVYLGERDDGQFEQQVALKRVRRSGVDGALVRRFLEERRILARLVHPRIARLLDGGVAPDGTPWFAMEYVDGERLDAWCDARQLPVERRLALFASICEAVQHAHQQLVVHRDLKPSNILVGADGELKLLDFGIAKLLAAADATEAPAADETRTGTMAMTPQYAAPEQLRGEPVSTATDVYALGVLLYELLTGRRPYDLRGKSATDVERIVCEEEPPRPSATFDASALTTPEDRVARARARGTTPERLRRTLRGDLDAIVLQALRKEPSRRYASAAALLEDLRRATEGRPVRARPDGAGYRLRRYVGRHRTAIAAGAVVLVALVGGYLRERSLREHAEGETRKARAVQAYMTGVFDVADPFASVDTAGRNLTARELLDRGAARLEGDLSGEPEVQAELRGTFGRVYTNLGLFDAAEQQARRALEQRRALHGPRHAAVASALDALGVVLTRLNRYDEAEPMLREALAQRRELAGPSSRETAETLLNLGVLLQEQGKLDAADTLFRESLAAHRAGAATPADSIALAGALNNLGVLLFVRGKYDDAEPTYREALDINRRLLGEGHAVTAKTIQNLAQVQQLRGKIDESEALYRQALALKRRILGDLHPSVTISLNNLGNFLLREKQDAAQAEPLIREAIALDRRIFGDTHMYVAAGLNNLSTAMRLRGEFADAARVSREAVDIAKRVSPEPNKETAVYLNGLASSLLGMEDHAGAARYYAESVEQYRSSLGEAHLFTQVVAGNLARLQFDRGQLDEAERLYRGSLAVLDSSQAAHRVIWIAAHVGIGRVLTARGRSREAIPMLERAVAASLAQSGETNWRTAEAKLALGNALAATGERSRAEPLLREAVAALEPQAKAHGKLLETARRALSGATSRSSAASGS